LKRELGRAQEICKIVDVEGKELFKKVKEEIIQLIDAKYEMQSRRMVRILSTYIKELYHHNFSFLSSLPNAQLYKRLSPPSTHSKLVRHPHTPLLDPEEVAKFISHPLQLYMAPGTVAWHDTVLSVTPPVLAVTTDASSSSLTTTLARHLIDRGEKIISTDIMTVDGDIVMVMENGTPGQFYCSLVSADTQMEMKEKEKMLIDVEEEE
jgi:hypothetical protein